MTYRQIDLPMLTTVCAWCEPDARGNGLGALSHGICPRHLRKLARDLRRRVAPRERKARTRVTLNPEPPLWFT
jgi:hypothetical protein